MVLIQCDDFFIFFFKKKKLLKSCLSSLYGLILWRKEGRKERRKGMHWSLLMANMVHNFCCLKYLQIPRKHRNFVSSVMKSLWETFKSSVYVLIGFLIYTFQVLSNWVVTQWQSAYTLYAQLQCHHGASCSLRGKVKISAIKKSLCLRYRSEKLTKYCKVCKNIYDLN